MKPLLIVTVILAVILVAVFTLLKRTTPGKTTTSLGTPSDIQGHIENLMNSKNEYAFLIITVQGTADFIQLTGDKSGTQLDLPLITERQKELEQSFRETAKELGLDVIVNKGSDGSDFLDINIHDSSKGIAKISIIFMESLFNITSSSKLAFEYDL
jgi:hypothetical protein